MTLIRSLNSTYGRIVAAYIVACCTLWIVLLIVLPQAIMADYSFWHEVTSADRATLENNLEKQYVDLQLMDLKIKRLSGGEEGEGESLADLEQLRASLAGEIAAIEAQLAGQDDGPRQEYTFKNYTNLGERHLGIFLKTLVASAVVTIVALLVCYPVVYYIAKCATPSRAALIILGLVVPYWVNEILRTFAWLMILSYNGLLNVFLQSTGLTESPILFLSGNSGVLVGMIYAYILFMVFPIYNTMETLDDNQLDAARDLGATSWGIHRDIIIPHAKPGIAVGCIMTFMLSAGSYAVPAILGGTTGDVWFTQVIYAQFMTSRNWNVGSAYSIMLLLVCLGFVLLVMRIARVRLQDIVR
ncbi:MAG TPA: ABC transporter permease [Verrucomicrobiales bacterium]|nr:ABC transporter permease [Verrucomicrobiales bacterium]